MNRQTEALKLALEALEECRRDPRLKYEHPYYDKTITAIREALAEQPAQPQQEPVALLNAIRAEPTEMIHKWRVIDIIQSSPPQGIYYTPPAQRKIPQNCGTGYCSCIECLKEPAAQQQELDELTAQRDKLADILTRTANALKGQPAELSSHSWHDLPEVAQMLKVAQQQPPTVAELVCVCGAEWEWRNRDWELVAAPAKGDA